MSTVTPSTKLLKATETYVRQKMSGEGTGHDWFHVERVRRTALLIAEKEPGVDHALIQILALLHDIGDAKLHGDEASEEILVSQACRELSYSEALTQEIMQTIPLLSYSSTLEKKTVLSREGQIVQDADRLDALGAIGIARAFAYGGKKGRELYNPSLKPQVFTLTDEYRRARSTTINHFYEKLFRLKDLMNTHAGHTLALRREAFIKAFLEEFYAEWQGER